MGLYEGTPPPRPKPRFHRSSRYLLWASLGVAVLCILHLLPTWCFGWLGVATMIWVSQRD